MRKEIDCSVVKNKATVYRVSISDPFILNALGDALCCYDNVEIIKANHHAVNPYIRFILYKE